MNWKKIFKGIIGGAKHAKPIRPKPKTTVYEPATPEPKYVCENCGMLIETGHKHTRSECNVYEDDKTNPDLRARVVLRGRNDPKIMLPYYYDDYQKEKLCTLYRHDSKRTAFPSSLLPHFACYSCKDRDNYPNCWSKSQ